MPVVAREENPNIRTLMAGSRVTSEINGEKEKAPRRKPTYPMSAERELARAYLGVALLIQKKSKPYIERLMSIYKVWADENVRTDARISIQDSIDMILEEYGDDIERSLDIKSLMKRTDVAAKVARRASIDDWKKSVGAVIKEDISEPFYMETMEDMLNKWVGESVSHISDMPSEYLKNIHDIIIWGYNTHQPLVNVYRKIELMTGSTKSRARLIARDQMGTLNCRMTHYEHESLGVTHYIWVTRRDSRVRDCHREFNGKVFSWNNPPAEWYSTVSKGIKYTGRYCHPGQAVGCRCVAKPVFDPDYTKKRIAEQKQVLTQKRISDII